MDLAALLSRVPTLADALDGDQRTLTHLGIVLASPRGITSVIHSLNLLERQLLTMAAMYDGAVERTTVAAEAGDARELDQAVSALAMLTLAYPAHTEGAWLVLRPGVLRHVPLPGIRIYGALANLSGADLDMLLQRLGASDIPYRHEDRRRLVGTLLRRPEVATELYRNLEPEPARILDVLIDHGVQRVADLGLKPFDRWERHGGPLHTLVQMGLAGVDLRTQEVFSWLDLRIGLRGRLFSDWSVQPPAVTVRPLNDPGPGTPRVVRRMHMLLDHFSTNPLPALAAGGIGVRPVRAAAKGFGMADGEVGLLIHLAISLGLVGPTEDDLWAPSPAVTEFMGLSPVAQWAAIIAAWRTAATVDETSGLPNRWSGEMVWPPQSGHRTAVVDVLTSLEPATGVDEQTLTRLCAWHHPDALGAAGADSIVQVLRLLDLVPADGAVGLTTMARALLEGGVKRSEKIVGPGVEQVVIQADHSVIAPPGLTPRVATELAAVAELQSDAGAQIWRITPQKIGHAMAEGWTRDQLIALLKQVSSVAVPPNVLVTVDDVAARHGRLRAGTVGSYLRCDDPVDLSAAAAVSAAKLRVLSPTVAVSPLARHKLIATLRSKGLMAIAEDAAGTAIPIRRVVGAPLPETGIPMIDDQGPTDPLTLAQDLLSS
ncbi:hypothetical protein BH24ACT15_BH24ACT15_08030 [soil metagenome]